MTNIERLAKQFSAEDPKFAKAWESSRLLTELIEARIKAGLSQADVARASGLSQPAVARIESFELNVRLSTFLRYAKAIGAVVLIVTENGEKRKTRVRSKVVHTKTAQSA